MKSNIYNLTFTALENYFIEHGENHSKAASKAKIIYNYLYRNIPHGLSERITNLLERDFDCNFNFVEITEQRNSEDAVKFLFELKSGETPAAGGIASACNAAVEAVLMRHDYGNALCISTQVGCNMGCAFCQSSTQKKIRNLEPYEMVLQILKAQEANGEKISRLTLMGIGEPLDNYENVKDFIDIIGHKDGLSIAPRHITVSTCGLVPEMKRLLSEKIPCNLAVSLHAPNDEIRSRLMPVNQVYGINELLAAVREITAVKNKKTTLEYIMLDGVNDSDDCARELVSLLKGIYCYVNLIPYNETNLGFKRSSADRIKAFYSILIQGGIRAVVRREFGGEIKAACGQLRADVGANIVRP
ncbi:MAG: 23S rRNA (adenine(2503)-C(2))-methyltransferase RlmN [Oscillospiraceae bacterium]|nr:23S rRNA (adenine(2503)-C(2))-methyltransferase RlmN [Oscillospiraceae bacterium]